MFSNQLGVEYIFLYYPRDADTDDLTPEQINNSVRDISYTELCNELICPITLDNFIIGETISQIIHCNHIFKKNGLMRWLSRNIKCPVCRYDLRTYNTATDTSPFTNNTYYRYDTNVSSFDDDDIYN